LFWELSPREIDACIIEYYRNQDVVNTRFGTICASMFNAQPHMGKGRKKMFDWTSFFKPITARNKKRSSLAEAQAVFHATEEALSGTRIKKT